MLSGNLNKIKFFYLNNFAWTNDYPIIIKEKNNLLIILILLI